MRLALDVALRPSSWRLLPLMGVGLCTVGLDWSAARAQVLSFLDVTPEAWRLDLILNAVERGGLDAAMDLRPQPHDAV